MTKMILTLPAGIDAEKFLNVATAIVRQKTRANYGVYREYKLGDLANGDSIDANLIDFNTLEAILELSEICPAEIHFEADGGESPWDGDACDEKLFNDALKELYGFTRGELDLFTEIVNEHHARAYA